MISKDESTTTPLTDNKSQKQDDDIDTRYNYSCSSSLYKTLEWVIILSLIVLILILLFWKEKKKNDLFRFSIVLFLGTASGVIYMLYLILELMDLCIESDNLFVKNSINKEQLKIELLQILNAKPKCSIKAYAYHNVVTAFYNKNAQGYTTITTASYPIFSTHFDEPFELTSYKDISGELFLNVDEYKDKHFVIIKVNSTVEFYDTETEADAKKIENELYSQVKGKDSKDESEISLYIDKKEFNLNQKNLNLKEGEMPMFYGKRWYVLFTLILMAEWYKRYVDSFTATKTFKVKKIVSNHYDLNSDEMNSKYKDYEPRIKIGSEQVNMKDYSQIKNNIVMNKTEEITGKDATIDVKDDGIRTKGNFYYYSS